jgi:hypothetical protein
MKKRACLAVAATICLGVVASRGADRELDDRLHHLRSGEMREWSDFPEQAEGSRIEARFESAANKGEHALRLRQQDVKQPWRVVLNGKELGRLTADATDQVLYFPVPEGRLIDGTNTLAVEAAGKTADDIRVGEFALHAAPAKDVLSAATVELEVLDATDPNKARPTPCRITVMNRGGALVTTAAKSNGELAVRPGVVYTATGKARIDLPAGDYRIVAGRGFEYGIEAVKLSLKAGDTARKKLSIRREVPTDGYVACDTHVHTLTYSGHGDATIEERMVTVAGEGVELVIATDHNRQIDYEPFARRQDVRQYFTPVIGNEVTTAVGHFNVFPAPADGPVPEYQSKDGNAVHDSIRERTRASVVILNHARDVHSGYRPFGLERHNAVTGENADSWLFRANAMEVINSGAQQTDTTQLFHDWLGLLNRGVQVAPIGASDSHDVSRFIVGQGRTYIRCKDDDPGKIDASEVVKNLVAGRVLVSCGLLVKLVVDEKYEPGDLVPAADGKSRATTTVLGPRWIEANHVALYANGVRIQEAKIGTKEAAGVKWRESWELPRFKHDVHLAAIATGPGVTDLHWPIARPYQPMSTDVNRQVIGISGAVWLDADGDGKRTSAYEYARRIVGDESSDVGALVKQLSDYDEAVAAQAAGLLVARGISIDGGEVGAAAKAAGPQVERGFQAFFRAWREGQIARSTTK